MSHIGRFGLAVVLIMGAACGGGPSANGKALLLGQTDHSGTRISLMKGSNVAGQTTTDSSGAYRIRGPDGAYDLRFEHDGYQPVVQADVVVKGNDRSVPDVTLRRGALIDPAPVQSLRLLGNSKALVQFDHGIGSPSYVVDLVSGSRVRIASGGAVSVRDANNQFATVSIDHLYRLDLTTGALDPVQPDEARSGVAAAGAYFYVGTDGNFNVLPTGALQASSLDFPFCQPFGFSTTGELTNGPGWAEVFTFQDCSRLGGSRAEWSTPAGRGAAMQEGKYAARAIVRRASEAIRSIPIPRQGAARDRRPLPCGGRVAGEREAVRHSRMADLYRRPPCLSRRLSQPRQRICELAVATHAPCPPLDRCPQKAGEAQYVAFKVTPAPSVHSTTRPPNAAERALPGVVFH